MLYLFSLSLRHRYSLTVRLLILLLLISTSAGACSTDTARNEQKEEPLERNRQNAQPDTMLARRQPAGPPSTIDFLGNPILADYRLSKKLDAYFARISTDFTLDADPIENIHKPAITDTIYTIRFGESVIELYAPSQTGELLLQVADIRNAGIALRSNMKVGMGQPELMTKLKNFDVRILQTNSEIVATSVEGAPASLRFYLKNGKVNRIRYEGYVD
ncbi:hypothetical protein H9Q13_14940 [Pontibacter sp. JH31]|uniref:Uncharacterized protein n=1 Tax=Pontibacter aquaedesilientis TaxID=2766980 RepID=A0ABR7XJL4_9BACT|nr:hypothetical protein [Pontibacter aquaedesilientis]MBD1398466.1 hypothetical protein [Pontibacter aquaedesilientis]